MKSEGGGPKAHQNLLNALLLLKIMISKIAVFVVSRGLL